jgi:hypothetical protein
MYVDENFVMGVELCPECMQPSPVLAASQQAASGTSFVFGIRICSSRKFSGNHMWSNV